MPDPVPPPVISVRDPLRGPGQQAAAQFQISKLDFTMSWGAQPGEATIDYVAESVTNPDVVVQTAIRERGVAVGSYTEISFAGRVFHGVCMSDVSAAGSGGQTRILRFFDQRKYLQDDWTFCAFNMVYTTIENSPVTGLPERRKRYWHILPNNFDSGLRTYTDTPLSVSQVLDYVFSGVTIGTPWARVYHPDQIERTLLNIDATNGRRLDAFLVEVSARQGLTFTLSQRLTLYWTRMGVLRQNESISPGSFSADGRFVFPPNTDILRDGTAMNSAPTRVFVLGGRNVYQIINVGLEPAWNTAWQFFYDEELFHDYVFRNFNDEQGVPYTSQPDDPEQIIGRHKARARSTLMTLRQFAAHEDTLSPPSGEVFRDYRKFAGRTRLDMPCVQYINTILFRCFKPPDNLAVIEPSPGRGRVVRQIPLRSYNLVEQQIARVEFNPATGVMTADLNAPIDGNGLAIIRGYQVAQDIFRGLSPDRFNLANWSDALTTWSAAQFHIDDSGQGYKYVLFDGPVIRAESLVERIDGHAVFRVIDGIDITIPPVIACLTFEAEPFIYRTVATPNGSLDYTVNEPQLHSEYLLDPVSGASIEIPFADGTTAVSKAIDIGTAYLTRQLLIADGGFVRYLLAGDTAIQLNGFYNRLTLHYGADGHWEEVDFANERSKNFYEPERDYDRRRAEQSLYPGQQELIEQARALKMVAAGLRQSRRTYKNLSDAFRGFLGHSDPTVPTVIDSPPDDSHLAVGTPLWRQPVTAGDDVNTGTRSVMPTSAAADHTVLAGVVTRNNEPANSILHVQPQGRCLVRVKGPCEVNDSLVKVNGQDYLTSKSKGESGAIEVGLALQKIADENVRLIMAGLGSGTGGGKVVARWA